MLKGFLNLFLKPHCPLCERPAHHVVCTYCQKKLKDCQRSPMEQLKTHGQYPLFIWGKYDQSLKRAIAAFKYEGHQEIGELLGQWLAECWRSSGLASSHSRGKRCRVLPIPLHPQKLKQRGFNQAAIIARAFAQLQNYPYCNQGLLRIKSTQPLFELNRPQRQQEMKSAFRLGHKLKGLSAQQKNMPIIIVDDIYTTGTTVSTAIDVLTAHGFKVKAVAAIASGK